MLDLILPCLNEAEALPWVLARVPDGVNPIVVDNGSTDGSPAIAERLGAQVVRCAQRGYGAACHAGLQAATAELVAFCDCDASINPDALTAFTRPVADGSADLVVGRRRTGLAGSWPLHARIANAALAYRVRMVTGVPLYDIGPLRVARRQALLELGQIDRRSGYPLETVLLAARAGWTIVERDIDYLPRAGRSKVTGTVRGTAQAIRDMSGVLAR
jgi:glycosyltransferase involved in cell wall biosynthesis